MYFDTFYVHSLGPFINLLKQKPGCSSDDVDSPWGNSDLKALDLMKAL
jgi:hypothetical protein